jgi:colanic acid/amylovoran biosynthesis glycosyltransferase
VRLAIVSAKFPYGPHEPYLNSELRALAPYFERITVFPTSPKRTAAQFPNIAAEVRLLELFSAKTVVGALRAFLARPIRTSRTVWRVLTTRSEVRVKAKNAAVITLGLAVGDELRRGGSTHVHSCWLSTPATVAYIAAQIADIPWSSTAHRWDIYERNALPLKLTSACFIRAISSRGKADLVDMLEDGASSNIEVVHVGVDVSEPAPAPDAFSDTRPFRLLCAANLVPVKGHADLFHAIALLRERGVNLRCTVAGDGPLRGGLKRLSNDLALTGIVEFRGSVEHKRLLDELHTGRYDALVLASREDRAGLMEGIPVALMEAMAAGVPVITTMTGSIPELVDEDCGRIVPQRDVVALATAIEILATDPKLRQRLAASAYQRVSDNFNVIRVGKSLAHLIGVSDLYSKVGAGL